MAYLTSHVLTRRNRSVSQSRKPLPSKKGGIALQRHRTYEFINSRLRRYQYKCVVASIFLRAISATEWMAIQLQLPHPVRRTFRQEKLMATRVLLADDHVLFAQALKAMLQPKYEVVDIVGNGRDLQIAARAQKPDVIVADITMPLMNGLDGIRALRTERYMPKIVFLTMHSDARLVRECFNCGGSAFVVKDCGFEELTVAIEAVLEGRQYVSASIAADLMDTLRKPSDEQFAFGALTSRQREILQLLAEGKTTKEIARITSLSTRTIEWHKYRIMRLLNARRGAELIRYAFQMKLVS
jgi:DNA-binding NarL/FixJ family response regulator